MLPSAVSDSRVHNILPNKIDTDFQFSRASSATRVNHQGLIEDVGYFGPEIVQNGNFSELGPEIITNGDFATDSDWTKGNGWSINNGKAIYQGSIASNFRQSNVLVSGKTHKLVFEITSNTSDGNLKLAGETVSGGGFNLPETVGVHTVYFVNTGSTNNFTFRITGATTGVLEIDNVSVKQVDPDDDWVINGEWEYVDNGVSITNATGTYNDSALYQLITLDSSKQYKATIDVSSISGSLQVYTGVFSAGFTVNTTGVKSFILDLTSAGSRVNLVPGIGSDVVIKSFSLVEVIGDKPRLDYDPLNPTCPHLLLEPQSTNSFRFSEDFTQSYWSKQNGPTVSSNQTISPEGIQNADTLVSANATNEQYLYNAALISVTSGNSVTISCFVKKLDYDYFHLRFTSTGSVFTAASAWYNISNGTLGTVETGITAKIEDYGNGWYRCSATRTATGTGNARVRLQLASSDNTAFVAGDGTKGTFIYGAQFEIQSYPTSYIPTAGATETRVQETCTNAGNLNTFNITEGVLYAEIAALADDLTFRSISINDGTDQNSILLRFRTTSNKINALIRNSGSAINNIQADATVIDFNKFAFAYESGDCKVYVNGNQASTIGSSAFTLPELFELDFSKGNSTNTDTFYGKVKSLATYNRKLTDTELYTITSTQYSAYSGMVAALGNYTIPC